MDLHTLRANSLLLKRVCSCSHYAHRRQTRTARKTLHPFPPKSLPRLCRPLHNSDKLSTPKKRVCNPADQDCQETLHTFPTKTLPRLCRPLHTSDELYTPKKSVRKRQFLLQRQGILSEVTSSLLKRALCPFRTNLSPLRSVCQRQPPPSTDRRTGTLSTLCTRKNYPFPVQQPDCFFRDHIGKLFPFSRLGTPPKFLLTVACPGTRPSAPHYLISINKK